MFAPPRREAREYLDMPAQDPHELRGLLREIRRANIRYGGTRLALHYLARFLPRIARRPVWVLDVATAGGDIPCAAARWARARRVALRIVAIDLSRPVLDAARAATAAHPEIRLARADARHLPFADGAFDIVLCALTLHHFSFEEAAQVLREIDRVACGGFAVSDLVRSWSAYGGAWLDAHLLARNRLARHDGPLSVLRSFTLPEVRRLAAAAGLRGVEVRTHALFRVALVRRPRGSAS